MSLKVLVTTRQLVSFAGSELVAWEVAEWFANRGDEVVVATEMLGGHFESAPRNFDVTTDLGKIELDHFDLIWSQHQMVLAVPYGLETCVKRLRVPLVVAVSLSPYELAEHLDGVIARAIGARPWANSQETAVAMSNLNRGIPPLRTFHVFHNAAPQNFWERAMPPRDRLERVLVVSNHVPQEVRGAVTSLRDAGIHVDVVGIDDIAVRVDRNLIERADAVISIGKTVAYALAAGRPVYVYDRFGGDGWLTQANFAVNARFNFSGRPTSRRAAAEEIAQELRSGYAAARLALPGLIEVSPNLRLDHHLNELREAASRDHPRWRAIRAGIYFSSKQFRAHLATVRRFAPVR